MVLNYFFSRPPWIEILLRIWQYLSIYLYKPLYELQHSAYNHLTITMVSCCPARVFRHETQTGLCSFPTVFPTEGSAEELLFVYFFKICVLVSTQNVLFWKVTGCYIVISALDFLSARCKIQLNCCVVRRHPPDMFGSRLPELDSLASLDLVLLWQFIKKSFGNFVWIRQTIDHSSKQQLIIFFQL